MKEGWTYKKLGEIAYYPNNRVPVSNLNAGDYVGVENLVKDRGGICFGTSLPNIESAIAFSNDDILIGNIRPYLRKIWYADKNGGASGDIVLVRVRKEWLNQISSEYLFKVLSSEQFFEYDNANTKGAKMPRGDREHISEFIVPIPSLAEQERIVAELDLLTGIIDKQTAQLKELDMLAQSIFYDMFGDPVEDEKGWERKEIGQIAMVKTGPFGSMLHKDDYVSKGIPLVNPVHMRNYSISPDIDFTVTTEKAIELSEYLLHTGDVVFARRGDIGRCAVVFDKEDGFLCGTGSLFVRFNIPISSIFLMYVIRTESFRNELVSKAKGATMLNLNSGIISELKVPLPPEMMQQTFAQKIESIESQKAAINRSIAETRKLLDYTMDKYFG